MPYRQNLRSAARRHLRAAQILVDHGAAGSQPGCKAVAGYLFGLAGELALKEIMRNSGMRELPAEQRRDDPFFAHFPALKALLADAAEGRRQGELLQIASAPRVFQHWETNMRYAPTEDIHSSWIEGWSNDARTLVEKMDE